MSIILRALKKIQNQKAEQAPAEAPGFEESQNLPDSSPQALADVFADDEPLSMPTPSAGGGISVAAAPSSAELVRSSRIIRILLGLIVVLGLATTGWFATKIYTSYNAPAPGTLQARTAKGEQKAPARQAVQKQQATIPAAESAFDNAASPTAPALTAAPALTEAEQAPALPTAPALPAAGAPAPPSEAQQPIVLGPVPVPAEPVPPAPVAVAAHFDESEAEEVIARTAALKEAAPVSVASVSPLFPRPLTDSGGKEAQSQQVERPELKINAIAWRAQEPKAIVNMQRVYVGDEIEGAKVKEILRKSIIFEFAGEEYEIRF